MNKTIKTAGAGVAALAMVALSAGAASAESTLIKIGKYGELSATHNIAWIKLKVTCSPDTTSAEADLYLTQVTHGTVQTQEAAVSFYNSVECSGNEECRLDPGPPAHRWVQVGQGRRSGLRRQHRHRGPVGRLLQPPRRPHGSPALISWTQPLPPARRAGGVLRVRRVGSGLPAAQAEGEPVDQRPPRRLDDVVPDADGDPRGLAVGGLDQHPGDRVGAVALVEDAHLVVDQLELRDLRVGLPDRLAQRLVERVDRAVALAGRRRSARRRRAASRSPRRPPPPPASSSVITRHDSTSKYDGRAPSTSSSEQQLERRVGRLEGVAARLQLLDPVGDPGDQVACRRTGRSRARGP